MVTAVQPSENFRKINEQNAQNNQYKAENNPNTI
jgi:hypothetical protein